MKTSSESRAYRFERITNENLPKKLEMFNILMETPLPSELFSSAGVGLKSIQKELGRMQDFKGIYGFIIDGKLVYLGESAYVLKRVLRQYKGASEYQRTLEQLIRSSLEELDKPATIQAAKAKMQRMQIVLMEIPDDLERDLTYIYLKCQYDCVYNRYD